MHPANLFLILASALIHVVAHVALKRSRDRAAFVWWLTVWAALLFAPVLALGWPAWPPVVWGLLGLSAVFEVLYFTSLARAYRQADLSVVYPLARGTAPLVLLVWSSTWLGERLTVGGVGGIALIVAGLYLINLPRLGAWREPLRSLAQPGPRWALAAGVCTSAYTALDRAAMRQVDPLLYTYLALWAMLALLTPLTVWQVGWRCLWEELRSSRLSSLVAGVTTLAAYTMVLFAMRAGTPAAYAGAVREVSVVFGAAAGMLLLGEPRGALRLAGAACVAAGVAAIAVLG